MPKRRRRRQADPWQRIVLGLDASRRVGWARYFEEAKRANDLERAAAVLRERIDTLVPEFLHLVDSVLHDRNLEAFGQAYRVQSLLDEYVQHRAKRGR